MNVAFVFVTGTLHFTYLMVHYGMGSMLSFEVAIEMWVCDGNLFPWWGLQVLCWWMGELERGALCSRGLTVRGAACHDLIWGPPSLSSLHLTLIVYYTILPTYYLLIPQIIHHYSPNHNSCLIISFIYVLKLTSLSHMSIELDRLIITLGHLIPV